MAIKVLCSLEVSTHLGKRKLSGRSWLPGPALQATPSQWHTQTGSQIVQPPPGEVREGAGDGVSHRLGLCMPTPPSSTSLWPTWLAGVCGLALPDTTFSIFSAQRVQRLALKMRLEPLRKWVFRQSHCTAGQRTGQINVFLRGGLWSFFF